MIQPAPAILGQTFEQFERAITPGLRGGRPRALAIYTSIFREGRLDHPELAIDLPAPARVLRSPSDEGEVVKFTQAVPGPVGSDNTFESESVLIPMVGRTGRSSYTLCVSSQVGCAMGCTFCETAQMGLIRSLTPAEIVAQWFAARHALGVSPRRIVFMGMGEPLDNLDNVLQAVAVLTDRFGPGVPMSRITISTVGRIDGIRRLAEQVRRPEWHRLNLAVSVNAGSDAVRSAIMPINRAMPMDALRDELLAWPFYSGAKICFEYVLIPGVNDARTDAEGLAHFVRPFMGDLTAGRAGRSRGIVNVIPYNPRRDSAWPAPTEPQVDAFMRWLVELGVICRRRRTKGREMMGACGQLGSERVRRRRVVPVSVSAAPGA